MRRLVVLAAATFAALLASRADAIEMFTNFNNGMNVGFPPMEVPVGIYRGFGRGGWNPHAEGTYFRSNPPVPAMMPTGQMPRPVIRTSGVSDKTFSSAEKTSDTQYVADRRRGSRYQRNSSSMPSNNSTPSTNMSPSTLPNETIQSGSNGPTPAKAPEGIDNTATHLPAQSNKAPRSVTVLKAQPSKSQTNSAPNSGANENRDDDFTSQSSSALFPNPAN